MKTLPLEDGVIDIIAKAAAGLGRPAPQEPQTDSDIRRVAAELGLGADALVAIAHGAWQPAAHGIIEGLRMFTTPFDTMTVNSYIVYDPLTLDAAAFDTGSDCSEMLESGTKIRSVFLTHLHGDHIFDLDRLVEKTGATAWSSTREHLEGTQAFSDGDVFTIGRLSIEARRTSGHAKGGTTFVIHGLTRRIAVVGDALFAGSMGRGGISYREALLTNQQSIFSLPDDTILCPGHGPLTTVGEERIHNPFVAATT